MGTGWEYRSLQLNREAGWFVQGEVDFSLLDTRLNQLGMEGWELVNVIYLQQQSQFDLDSVVVFLKRPLS
ncbi:MAG TPA: DUF4177 domain-containing protein [Pyrinomonadaceae bacterium]